MWKPEVAQVRKQCEKHWCFATVLAIWNMLAHCEKRYILSKKITPDRWIRDKKTNCFALNYFFNVHCTIQDRAFDTDRINGKHCKTTQSDVKCDDFILQCPFSAVSNVSVWCSTHRFNDSNYAQKVQLSQTEYFWAKVQWKHWLFLCHTGEEWRIGGTRFRWNMDGKQQTVPVFSKANSLGANLWMFISQQATGLDDE